MSSGPDAKRLRGGAEVAAEDIESWLKELEAQISALRASPPPYVRDIGELHRPSFVCDDDGQLERPCPVLGPLDLDVRVCGQEGDEAYGQFFRVVLRFDYDLWPKKLATVRFRGVFHHGLTREDNSMTMSFYRALLRDENRLCTVRLMLESVHNFLVDPLSAWKSEDYASEEKAEKVKKAIDTYRTMNMDRLKIIAKYREQVLHGELFKEPARWQEQWLDPAFLRASRANTAAAWRDILTEDLPAEVFSFKLFTDTFCDFLVEELFNFYKSGLPARRPNNMNAYGIILNDIGFEPMIDELQSMLQPLGQLLFPGPGSAWDGHHCFIVRYRAGEDLGLDMHTDDSDVTFNICLGLEFAGAGLQFCGAMGAPDHRKHSLTYHHKKGSCVMHLGRKRHGADDISSGERLNLILWNHGSAYRQTDAVLKPPYEVEKAPPDAVCVSFTHDRDYGQFKEYPAGKEHFRKRGWCPRKTFEYEGFKADFDSSEEELE